ncbi:GNAT family N-acetyltransferase [Shewanella sp. D64]|uniref:GNAT family N-acetyltransferase n=1 Tax=unclassified Shewanella TaxID=196818 RepID=UPI0022BA40A9|nr:MULTISPECIES: GNAT family N-acetyltransferase [unclassified Shewanella]MEC4726957.1 GNAT family N-acetyltransferase [Shewanella sp. D64]MEC4738546.1 GNAT family N-acetyltransferase [Shewanella sp. E94]WBJ93764.1 GNAT family N-acetyltransferase [Shewanella sp. MTB7]
MSDLQLSSLVLKPHSEVDLPFLLRLYTSVRRDEFAAANWPESQLNSFLSEQFNAQYRYYCQHYSADRFNIIYLQNQSVGRLFVDYWLDERQEIRIVDISLLPEFRGLGISTKLFENLFAEARDLGLAVTIHVERNNPARGLYERLGFKLKTVTDEVYLLMEWRAENRASNNVIA